MPRRQSLGVDGNLEDVVGLRLVALDQGEDAQGLPGGVRLGLGVARRGDLAGLLGILLRRADVVAVDIDAVRLGHDVAAVVVRLGLLGHPELIGNRPVPRVGVERGVGHVRGGPGSRIGSVHRRRVGGIGVRRGSDGVALIAAIGLRGVVRTVRASPISAGHTRPARTGSGQDSNPAVGSTRAASTRAGTDSGAAVGSTRAASTRAGRSAPL